MGKVWMLIILLGGGGADHIPTAGAEACKAARAALLDAMKEQQTWLNSKGEIRALTVAVCVPIEQFKEVSPPSAQ